VEILSGIFNGFTTGAPICLLVWNKNIDSSEYEKTRFLPRPGHSDYTAFIKYGGFNDYRGGGMFSGRITAAPVMAGAIAKKLLSLNGIEIVAATIEIGGIKANPVSLEKIKENVAGNPLRCADLATVDEMTAAVTGAKEEGDSLGGIIEGIAINVPVGLGEPLIDTLDGELAKALFSIPAVKGVEFGSGFSGSRSRGSDNNDQFTIDNDKIVTKTNNSGGILGGISNGMPIVVRVAVKPTSSIANNQQTVNLSNLQAADLTVKGRHDACIVPRAVIIVESVMALTLCDFMMRAGLIQGVIK